MVCWLLFSGCIWSFCCCLCVLREGLINIFWTRSVVRMSILSISGRRWGTDQVRNYISIPRSEEIDDSSMTYLMKLI